jgi:hypothetical protein
MKTQTELSLTASIPLISPTQSGLLVVPKDLDYVVELTRYHFIKPSALSSLVEQVEDSALKAAMTERWQVIQAKKLAREKPSIRPPGMKI